MTEPTDIPPEWAEAVRSILLEGKGRVVVLGPQDVGKSSFCRVLLDEAVRVGRGAALVDADLGQKAVGPPAAVTLAYADRPGELAGLAFVGTTDPMRGLTRVVEGTRRLAAEARADLVVVNTGGLVAGVGRKLKAAKLAAVRPDIVIALGTGPELDAMVERNAACPLVRLAPSALARRKRASRRRRAREEAFRRYFEGAPVWHLRAGALAGADPAALPERLLVGIADRSGRDLALAILLGGRMEEGRLDLLGPDPGGRAAMVVPGMLRLDEDFREPAAAPRPARAAGSRE
jgi:polynucleotide 5'-hydroxyl-kinase GRC3/NOL9